MPVINHGGVSGGKDSTRLMLWMVHESGYPKETLRFTFCDTGNEDQVTYDYIRYLSETVHEIEWIKPPLDFYELARKKGRFPSGKARFCTTELKVLPSIARIKQWQDEGYTIVGHTGVRASESHDRARLPQREPAELSDHGYEIFRPLLHESLDDVWAAHARYGIKRNPLYDEDCERVGCFPCIFSKKKELRNIAKRKPERFALIRMQEKIVGGEERGSTFFIPNKVPLRFRSTIVQCAAKKVRQRFSAISDDLDQTTFIELLFDDDYLQIYALSENEKREALTRRVAIATVDDVIRWALSGEGETEELDFDDLEEPPSCASHSGLCE